MCRIFASGNAASIYFAPQFENLSRPKLLKMAGMGYSLFQGEMPSKSCGQAVKDLPMRVLTNAAAAVYCFMHGEDRPDGTFAVEDLDIAELERSIVL